MIGKAHRLNLSSKIKTRSSIQTSKVQNKNENNQENEEKIIYFLNEIKRDLKNTELELRIEELESKFSKDFSENTFNELKELKKQQKIN